MHLKTSVEEILPYLGQSFIAATEWNRPGASGRRLKGAVLAKTDFLLGIGVAQLAERSLPMPEGPGSNPSTFIERLFAVYCLHKIRK